MSQRPSSSANQFNKYYHNDIKKQLAIDDSRTASEKLLDKVVKVDKRVDYLQQHDDPKLRQRPTSKQNQPRKKVKISKDLGSTQNAQNSLQIMRKLFKNIVKQTNVQKLIKTLSVLKKVLAQESFLNDQALCMKNRWVEYSQRLIEQIALRNQCSSEANQIMQLIAGCLEALLTFSKSTASKALKDDVKQEILSFKVQSKPVQQEFDDRESKKLQQQNQNQLKSIAYSMLCQLSIWYCRMFTDDSWAFIKNLNLIKSLVFQTCQHANKEQQNQKQINSEQLSESLQTIWTVLMNLLQRPIKYGWAFRTLCNFFKEFNNNSYNKLFNDPKRRKEFLNSYNQFLLSQKSTQNGGTSYEIMGKSTSATFTSVVQADQIPESKNIYDF